MAQAFLLHPWLCKQHLLFERHGWLQVMMLLMEWWSWCRGSVAVRWAAQTARNPR